MNKKGRACLWTWTGPWGAPSGLTQDGDVLWFVSLDCALDVPARAELRVACHPSDIHPAISLRTEVPGRLQVQTRTCVE